MANDMLALVQTETDKFNELLRRYPRKIPLRELADFLGMKDECLRNAIEQKQIPGAFSTVGDNGNRAFYIKPVPFMMWYFNLNVRDVQC